MRHVIASIPGPAWAAILALVGVVGCVGALRMEFGGRRGGGIDWPAGDDLDERPPIVVNPGRDPL